MSKLTNTIRTEVDNDYFMDIADFRDYARSMMFPDPVGIDMSDEFNDMVTEAVNSGKTTLEDAFKKLVKRDSKGRIDYCVWPSCFKQTITSKPIYPILNDDELALSADDDAVSAAPVATEDAING